MLSLLLHGFQRLYRGWWFGACIYGLIALYSAPGICAEGGQTGTYDDSTNLLQDFSAHDPMYFVFGAGPTEAKFQLSFKYRLIGQEKRRDANGMAVTDTPRPWYEGFLLAYSQTSFWDLGQLSKPFRDSSYRPALFYEFQKPDWTWLPGNNSSYLRLAFQHESNGKDGAASRSFNIVYIEPSYSISLKHDLALTVRPRAWAYVTDLSDNPDIQRYRGNVSLSIGLIQTHGAGAVLSVIGNPSTGKAAFNADLTLSLKFLHFQPYLNAQIFTGYGESLLGYNKRSTRARVGFSFVR